MSARQPPPAATHTTRAAAPTAHTTIGSSALATTVVCGCAANTAATLRAVLRTSEARSSWSRLRLSSTTTSGRTASTTGPRCSSSISSTHSRACGVLINAATAPSGIFGPSGIVRHRTTPGQRRRHQVTRRGLAIGAGDHHRGPAHRQTSQHIWAHPDRYPPPDHRPRPGPQPPRHPRRGPARRHGHPSPQGPPRPQETPRAPRHADPTGPPRHDRYPPAWARPHRHLLRCAGRWSTTQACSPDNETTM